MADFRDNLRCAGEKGDGGILVKVRWETKNRELRSRKGVLGPN